jgi:hypothetical protein
MIKRQCFFFCECKWKIYRIQDVSLCFSFLHVIAHWPIRSIESRILLLVLACAIGCQTFIFALIILRICPWKMC